MKCLSQEDRELIRRARRDGREARGNEEREKREDEKGSHCFFKSSGYDKLELKYKNLVFSSLQNALLKCHGVKQKAKICPIGEQKTECNKFKSLSQEDKELIRRERRDGGEGEERGLRKGERDDRDREKRNIRELS